VQTRETDEAIEQAINGDLQAVIEDDVAPEEQWSDLSEKERQELEKELGKDGPLTEAIREVSLGLMTPEEIEAAKGSRGATPVRGSATTLMDPEVVERYVERPEVGTKGFIDPVSLIKGVVTIAYKVIRRFVNERDHGLHATVVEEILGELYVRNIAGGVWELMKGDTADAFKSGPTQGGTAFLEELRAALPADEKRRITLVGHSTGAIYIAELLKKADEVFADRPDVVFEVVFLAPAATFNVIHEMLVDYGHRIGTMQSPKRTLRMFTMQDELERGDKLLGVIYPHSLLYFVSGVCERDKFGDEPIVGMQRYFDREHFTASDFPMVDTFRDMIVQQSNNYHVDHVAWSLTSVQNQPPKPAGCRTNSRSHGDFDNDPDTISSIVHILKDGF
jgi:hypothetical protein